MNHRDEEMIALLMAISVVAKRLAEKITRLSQEKGGKKNGYHRQRNQGLRRKPQSYR